MTDETQASLMTLPPLAKYTKGSKTRSPVLTITRIVSGRRELVSLHDVAGKRDARALAKTLNATCWNF